VGEAERSDERMLAAVREAVREVMREAMGADQSLFEGKFYHNVAVEMENGVGQMYQEISQFKKALAVAQQTADESEKIISDASGQLEGIVKTTEMATNQIMDAAENCQQRNNRLERLLGSVQDSSLREELQNILNDTNQEYMNIITACSFQDLTGQRVKKVVELIKTLERQIIKILIKADSKIKGKKAGKGEMEIEGDTQKALEKLGGPQDDGIDQAGVDDLLASLGL